MGEKIQTNSCNLSTFAGSMSTFVSLSEVLKSRGSALDEDEVWAILLTAAEALTSVSCIGAETYLVEYNLVKKFLKPAHHHTSDTLPYYVIHLLLLFTALNSSGPGNLCSVISPGSVLISPSGSVAFKTCGRADNVASFTPPETTVARSSSSKEAVEKVRFP